MNVKCLTVNMKQENTYVLSSPTRECIIIDCGCKEESERNQLSSYITENSLTPVRLLCTHAHLDHMFGAAYVRETYGIRAQCSHADHILVDMAHFQAVAFALDDSEAVIDEPEYTLTDNLIIPFANTEIHVLATPGHSPGGVSFYLPAEKILFSGDTLFRHDVGATNLPGARRAKLLSSIRRLFTLPDDVVVYSGHGLPTTIGEEKVSNPIVSEL